MLPYQLLDRHEEREKRGKKVSGFYRRLIVKGSEEAYGRQRKEERLKNPSPSGEGRGGGGRDAKKSQI